MAMSKLELGKKLFIADGFRDGVVTKCVVQGSISDVPELFSTHGRAYTRIFLHAAHAASKNERLVIWSPYSDVGILVIHFREQLAMPEIVVEDWNERER